ncbi:MAG: hypothetical protein N2446_02180, partial [Elusimicrobiales bacterium]|nr:hypothetical protein [Elusimicrobiales bacterium]
KKIIFVLVVWLMFLIPFLILASHFKNSVKSMAMTTSLYKIDMLTSNVSWHASSLLELNYNVFNDFNKKNFSSKDIIEFLKSKKGSIMREFVIYDLNMKKIFGSGFTENSSYKEIIDVIKKTDMPSGIVEYPDDKPADLVVGRKIGNFYVLYRCDLGYLISKIMMIVSKIDGIFYIVDEDFNIIYDSSNEYLVNVDKKISPEIKKTIEENIKNSRFSYRGILTINSNDFLFSTYNIENTKWWAISILNTSQVNDPILSNWVFKVVVIGIILMLIFSYITLLVGRKLIC